ncbi:hypothetical protein MRB53_014284 [Persea americana]|uniref:Uncharacterized protein n=1 Tax=Persea americana TaxID=3435 RepID=A0ACC2KAE1_PERAE|nr:hypothetical protein MRB53_014284 [Persea americana]
MWGPTKPKTAAFPAVFFLSGSRHDSEATATHSTSDSLSPVVTVQVGIWVFLPQRPKTATTETPNGQSFGFSVSSPVTARNSDKDQSSSSPLVDQPVFFSGRSTSPVAALVDMDYLGTLFGMGKKICEPLQSLKENEGILDKKIEELSCRENDIKADLETGKLQSGKMPKREAELWLKNVQNIKDDVRDIKKKLEEVRWTHFHLRINLAKQVEEKIKEAVELRENGRFQEGLFVSLFSDGIFDEIEDREKGFDKGYTIINDLKEACMLVNGKHDGLNISFVKMHDLVRDLAIAITKKSHQFVVKVRSKVDKFPRDENLMGDVIRVSLMYSDIEMLSCQPKCPKLSTLLMEGSRLGYIDHLFFEHMQNLRVLDLSRTCIKFLPQSLSNLVNLHALLLRDCWKLTEVPSVVQLTELRVLNLTGTAIRYLPDGMDGLTNLRCLGLSATKSLEMVPVGAISSFSHLEELSMVESKWKWSSNENRNGRGAGVEDIVGLMHLKKLLVDFIDLSALSSYVRAGHWRGLNCFVLTVGYECAFVDVTGLQNNFYSRERQVYVSGIGSMNSVAFPKSNLSELVISDLHNLSTIYMEEPTPGDNLANLKYIHIENCPKLRYAFSVGWLQTLQNLECIWVSSCEAMEEMVVDLLEWKNPNTKLHLNTLANLKYIHISNCPKLKYVLSVGWFQTLQNLEEISVLRCQAMEEMVVDMGDFGEANNNVNITLPRLEKLTLADLPKLKSICKKILICSSLENITALYCPMLKMLPFSINSIPSSLKHIEGSRRWWDSLDWGNHDTKMHLQPFFLDLFGEEEERRGTKRKADNS